MEAVQAQWLEEKVEGWSASVAIMSGVAVKHPQTDYTGLKKSLQKEWNIVQRVTLDKGTVLQPIEDALRDAFLPALFKGATYQIPGRAVNSL